MERPDIELIHHVMQSNDMVVFKKPFDVTLGAVRTNDNASGKFNDWIFASMFTKNGGIISTVFEGTTDAGMYYRENPINPKGTAVIKHGMQHRSAFKYMEVGGHNGQEAFRQVKKMWYWRDADRNRTIDFDGDEHFQLANTNGHDMGSIGNDIGKWSAGCWGSVEDNMDLLYIMAKVQIEHGNGDSFSLAMLHESMFK